MRSKEKSNDTFVTFKKRVLEAKMTMLIAMVAMMPMMLKPFQIVKPVNSAVTSEHFDDMMMARMAVRMVVMVLKIVMIVVMVMATMMMAIMMMLVMNVMLMKKKMLMMFIMIGVTMSTAVDEVSGYEVDDAEQF